MNHPSKTVLSAMFVVALAGQGLTADYSLKGSFTYQTHTRDASGNIVGGKILNRTFNVLVDDNKWTIKVVLVGNPEFEYFLYSFDGTNISYYCKHSPKAKVIAGSPATNISSNWLEAITVETSRVPKTITTAAGEYIWLAFASQAYFQDLPSGSEAMDLLPLQTQNIGHTIRRQVPCEFNLSTSPPFLITDAKFFEKKNGNAKPDSGVPTNTLGSPFNDEWLLAEYQASDFTNAFGVTLPKAFKYVRYKPIVNAKSSRDVTPTLTVKGHVESISQDAEKWKNEIPNEKAVVFDLRLAEPNVMYVTTNGSIPPTNSNVVLDARKIAAKTTLLNEKQASSNSKNQDLMRRVVIFTLLLTFALPLIIITYSIWKKKYNAKTK